MRTMVSAAPRTVLSWHGPLAWFAASMGIVAVIAMVGLLVDHRVLLGAPIWAKALKFAISFGIYAVSLGWMIHHIRRPRLHRLAWWAGTVLGAASVFEMVAIVGQIIRGTRSHFNTATPFDSTVFSIMGGLVAVIYLAALIIGLVIAFTPMRDTTMRLAVGSGSLISILGLSVGFLMLQPTPDQAAQGDGVLTSGAHGVGVADGGPSIPILGWSATGGDLRIPHFIGMHALQLLPLFAIVLTVYFSDRLTGRARVQIVALASAVYAAVFALTLGQALRGQAITSPDGWTILVALAIVLGAGAGIVAIQRDAKNRRLSTTSMAITETSKS
jgi:hypothetical protein